MNTTQLEKKKSKYASTKFLTSLTLIIAALTLNLFAKLNGAGITSVLAMCGAGYNVVNFFTKEELELSSRAISRKYIITTLTIIITTALGIFGRLTSEQIMIVFTTVGSSYGIIASIQSPKTI